MTSDQPAWWQLLANAQEFTANLDAHPPTSVNGIPWNQLAPPRRWHRCWPQSWGSCGPFKLLERCPCGGTRIDGDGPWLYRNRRRDEHRGLGPHRGRENVGDTGPDLLIELRDALREER